MRELALIGVLSRLARGDGWGGGGWRDLYCVGHPFLGRGVGVTLASDRFSQFKFRCKCSICTQSTVITEIPHDGQVKLSRVPMPSPFVAEPAPGPLQGPADGGVGGQDGLTQEEDDGQDHSSTHRHSHPLSRHRVPSGQKFHHQLFPLSLRRYAQSNNCFLCCSC
jgi:hypothetical protein